MKVLHFFVLQAWKAERLLIVNRRPLKRNFGVEPQEDLGLSKDFVKVPNLFCYKLEILLKGI